LPHKNSAGWKLRKRRLQCVYIFNPVRVSS